MKGLTLTQPWATLVALGAKRIETRAWSTPYRGPLAIYAGKGLGGLGPGAKEDDLRRLVRTEPFASALGHQFASALPRGVIVAVCDLVEVIDAVEAADGLRYGAFEADGVADVDRAAALLELEFGNYKPYRHAWILDDVRALVAPVEIPKGAVRSYRGLWDVPAPSELLALINSTEGVTA